MVKGKGGLVNRKGLNKGTWTKEEDEKLRAYIQKYGHWNWRQLPKFAGLTRCGKSCRLRWMNYLRPGVKRGNFTKEEEDLILALHEHHGNKWSKIAAKLPGRTDNDIKNHWHTRLKKLQKEQQVVLYDNKKQSIETTPNLTTSQTMSETEQADDSSLAENNGPNSRQATSIDTFSCVSQETTCDDLAFFSCFISDHGSMSGLTRVAEDYTFMGSSVDGGSDNLDFWTRPFEEDCYQDDGYNLFSYAAFDDSLDLFFQIMPDPSENM